MHLYGMKCHFDPSNTLPIVNSTIDNRVDAKHKSFRYVTSIAQMCNMNRPVM